MRSPSPCQDKNVHSLEVALNLKWKSPDWFRHPQLFCIWLCIPDKRAHRLSTIRALLVVSMNLMYNLLLNIRLCYSIVWCLLLWDSLPEILLYNSCGQLQCLQFVCVRTVIEMKSDIWLISFCLFYILWAMNIHLLLVIHQMLYASETMEHRRWLRTHIYPIYAVRLYLILFYSHSMPQPFIIFIRWMQSGVRGNCLLIQDKYIKKRFGLNQITFLLTA